MCELLALSMRYPSDVRLSFGELAKHGGGTGPHRDGWGIAYYAGGDAAVFREPGAAHESRLAALLRDDPRESDAVVAHVRKATQGERVLRNVQPFVRELGGRAHVFAHNGMLDGIERDARFATRRFRRIGDTDSEQAFVALMERLGPLYEDAVPTLEARLAVVADVARGLRELGPANFLYADGDAIFAHAHRRRGPSGAIEPPGLWTLCRTCAPGVAAAELAGLRVAPGHEQHAAIVASVPLSPEAWEPMREGELVVLREGRIALRA